MAAVLAVRLQRSFAIGALQDKTDLCHGACLPQYSRSLVDQRALFGCCVAQFVFFVVDALFERCYLLVAGTGVALGPFGGAVERASTRARAALRSSIQRRISGR